MKLRPVLDASLYCDLKVLECGRERCIPDKHFEYTVKPYHLFHYILSGSGVFEADGHAITLGKGSLFYIPPHGSARYSPSKARPWQYAWVGFDGQMAPFFVDACGLSAKNPVFYDSDDSLRAVFDGIAGRYQLTGSADTMCLGYLYQILTLMADGRGPADRGISSKEGYVQTTKDFIRNNYQFDIKIADIAANVGVNPNYLSSVFKQTVGMTPKSYLIHTRMERSRALFNLGKRKVKEVAEAVGYASQLHFSAEFKKTYGVPPLEYINTLQRD